MIRSCVLQARSHLVEIGKAGRQSGQDSGTTFHLLDFLQQLFGNRLDVNKALANSFVGELKDRVLGVIENDLRLVFLLECFLRDLVRGLDRAAAASTCRERLSRSVRCWLSAAGRKSDW